MLEGARAGTGGTGETARAVACPFESDPPNTCESAGRDFVLCVGMVRRSAAGLEEGVLGRVGGTLKSCIRLVELLCDLALEAAVGSSYLDLDGGMFAGTSNEVREACFATDSITEREAFRASRVVEGGVGGLRPECDFWFRRLPGLGDKNEPDGEGEGDGPGLAAEKAW
jgi:hypothetical protein